VRGFDVLGWGSKDEFLVKGSLVIFGGNIFVFEHAIKDVVLTIGSSIRIGAKRRVAGRSLREAG